MDVDSPAFWILAFGITGLFYVGLTLFGRWCYQSPAVPLDQLNQLRVGMTAQEVCALLGQPRTMTSYREHPEWRFGHRLKRHVLIVRFGADGRVFHFVHTSTYDPEHRELT